MLEQNKTEKINLFQEDILNLLTEIDKKRSFTQRQIATRTNLSLGKTNYLVHALICKGILKIKNFSNRPEKLGKLRYVLTPKGFEEKFRLTYYFLKKKEEEYKALKVEWEKLNARDKPNKK
ncbi:MAG: MarR family EPS-associated transcriptional regulator [Candidatus Omnitrophica bacterium]|nr:MarR family EPS-associated transcriptional regulator [Candidatus Omnitrophota bacterium]